MADIEKLRRIVDIRDRLQTGARLTVERMMGDYGVNRRTVTRDVETLVDDLDMELVEEKTGDGRKVWSAAPRSRKIEVQYTLLDVTALFLGKRLFDFLAGTSLEERFEGVYSRIESQVRLQKDLERSRLFTRKLYRIHEGPKKLDKRSLEVLDEVLTGLLYDRKVKIRHVAASGDSHNVTLLPYTVVAYKRGLYVLGSVEEYGERPFTFAIERIKRADCVAESFEYPEDFDPDEFFRDTPFLTTGEPVPVELVFTAQSAPFVLPRHYHRSQTVTKLEGGRIRMRLEIPVNFETVNWVLGFGANVEVVGPPELREMVKEQLAQALAAY